MEACWHKYIEMMMNRPYMGGMASKGYGMTKVEILTRDGKKFEDISRAKDFDAWLKDNKDQIAHDVINMKKILCS
jgi:CRISPR/Cas system CSM-associated protein Csm3 (group 7 of RAMP superfamily)